MDSDPKRDDRGEAVRNYRFPTLKHNHPSLKVVRSFEKNALKVLFRLKGKLKQVWTQIGVDFTLFIIEPETCQ